MVFDARMAEPAILNREARRTVEALGLPGSCEVDMPGEGHLAALRRARGHARGPEEHGEAARRLAAQTGQSPTCSGSWPSIRPATGHRGWARSRAHAHRARTAAHPLGERGTGDDFRLVAAPVLGGARGRQCAGGAQLREDAPTQARRRSRLSLLHPQRYAASATACRSPARSSGYSDTGPPACAGGENEPASGLIVYYSIAYSLYLHPA